MESLLDAIGNTPLLNLGRGLPSDGAGVYAKLERFNPGVSIKDRTVLAMIEAAESNGSLKPGGTVVEPVAGNTGIALAHICNVRGYKLILTMPEDYMPERRHILECCGTRIVTTPAADGVDGAIEAAKEILKEDPEYFMPDHFSNRAQMETHSRYLVPEIEADLGATQIHAVVGCVGAGSSLAALAASFRPRGSLIIAVEPAGSPFLSRGERGRHAIPGIGFGYRPEVLAEGVIDRVETIRDEEAVQGFRDLARENGVLAGLSSGANYIVCKKLAKELGAGKNILTLFYDGGERYFSAVNQDLGVML